MAVEDPDSPHGLKLSVADYPYANDGLVLWDIIKDWVTNYVNHYYPEENLVESDEEIQAWWTEIRTQGHNDDKDIICEAWICEGNVDKSSSSGLRLKAFHSSSVWSSHGILTLFSLYS